MIRFYPAADGGRSTLAGAFRENRCMETQPPAARTEDLDPEDYYFEGPLMVFTAAYHLKRGYCCGSGCRHCPYGNGAGQQKTPSQPE